MSLGLYECIMIESVNVNGTYVCGKYVGFFLSVYVCVQCLYVVCCLSVCLYICMYVCKSFLYDVYVCWHICLYV